MKNKILLLYTVIFLFSLPMWAAFNASANVQVGQKSKSTSTTATIGSVVIDGITYQKIEVQPLIRIGKLKAALNLRFYLDSDNKLKDADGNGKPDEWESWRDIVSKILYIQYAQKGARPLYARLGDLRNAAIGHGFIMSHYTNTLNALEYRKIGLQFDLNFPRFGIETITNDITKLDIVGVRPFWRPFASSSINLLKNFAIGVSVVADRNVVANYEEMHFGFNKNIPDADEDGIIDEPYVKAHNLQIPDSYVDTEYNSPYDTAYERLKNKSLAVYGFDLETILFQNAIITAKLYGDFAKIRDYGYGFAFPGIEGSLLKFLRIKGEYRSYTPDFIPSIFDAYYESRRMRLDRENKTIHTILDDLEQKKKNGGQNMRGGYFQISYENSRYVRFLMAYQNYVNSRPRLYGVFEIKPELSQRYSNQRVGFKLTYEQNNLPRIRDFSFVNENTIIRYVLTYGVSANVDMRYIYVRTFDHFGKPSESTSIEMSMRF